MAKTAIVYWSGTGNTEEMAKAAQLRVALETDCHIGRDWYEAK